MRNIFEKNDYFQTLQKEKDEIFQNFDLPYSILTMSTLPQTW